MLNHFNTSTHLGLWLVKFVPILLAVLLSSCAPATALPLETEPAPIPSPLLPVLPEPTPVPLRVESAPLALEGVYQQVELPLGWAAAVGPHPLAGDLLGWTAFNSWGEENFWPASTADLPENGVSAVLLELPEWGQYGPEHESESLSELLPWRPCRDLGPQGSQLKADFFKWTRSFRLQIYCGPQASATDLSALEALLQHWRFAASAPGDPGYALLAASRRLPAQVEPDRFLIPLSLDHFDQHEGSRRRTTTVIRPEPGAASIRFTYTWDELPLSRELDECPADRCRTWEFTVLSDGEIQAEAEHGAALPDPSRPERTPPASLPALHQTPPAVLYALDDQLFEIWPSQTARRLAKTADLGEILSSLQVGSAVYVLRQDGLEGIELDSLSSRTIQTFSQPAQFGQLQASPDGEQIYYSAAFEGGCDSTGFGAQVGVYYPKREAHTQVQQTGQYMRLLGPTQDRKSLLLQPVGCDPSFASIRQVSLSSGQLEREIAVRGEDFAELSPRARYFATIHARPNGDQAESLAIYDLASRQTIPLMVELPETGAHISHMSWNPDATWLYFSLASNRAAEAGPETLSYGLWRANPFSGRLEKVIGGMPGGALRLAGSRLWLLARLPGQAIAMQVDLRSGDTRSLKLPWPAVPGLSPNELPSRLSPDGAWLLVWHVPQGKASLTHLVSGTAGIMDLPAEAFLLGWR